MMILMLLCPLVCIYIHVQGRYVPNDDFDVTMPTGMYLYTRAGSIRSQWWFWCYYAHWYVSIYTCRADTFPMMILMLLCPLVCIYIYMQGRYVPNDDFDVTMPTGMYQYTCAGSIRSQWWFWCYYAHWYVSIYTYRVDTFPMMILMLLCPLVCIYIHMQGRYVPNDDFDVAMPTGMYLYTRAGSIRSQWWFWCYYAHRYVSIYTCRVDTFPMMILMLLCPLVCIYIHVQGRYIPNDDFDVAMPTGMYLYTRAGSIRSQWWFWCYYANWYVSIYTCRVDTFPMMILTLLCQLVCIYIHLQGRYVPNDDFDVTMPTGMYLYTHAGSIRSQWWFWCYYAHWYVSINTCRVDTFPMMILTLLCQLVCIYIHMQGRYVPNDDFDVTMPTGMYLYTHVGSIRSQWWFWCYYAHWYVSIYTCRVDTFPMMISMLLCPLVCIYIHMQGRYIPNDDFDVTMPTGMYLYTRAGSIRSQWWFRCYYAHWYVSIYTCRVDTSPMMILMLLCPLVCIYIHMQGRYVPNDDFDVTMPTGMYLYTHAGSICSQWWFWCYYAHWYVSIYTCRVYTFPMMILMLLCPLVCIYIHVQGRYVPNDDFDVTMPTGMYLYTHAGSIHSQWWFWCYYAHWYVSIYTCRVDTFPMMILMLLCPLVCIYIHVQGRYVPDDNFDVTMPTGMYLYTGAWSICSQWWFWCYYAHWYVSIYTCRVDMFPMMILMLLCPLVCIYIQVQGRYVPNDDFDVTMPTGMYL